MAATNHGAHIAGQSSKKLYQRPQLLRCRITRGLRAFFPFGGTYHIAPPSRVRVSSPYARLGPILSSFTVTLGYFNPLFFIDVQPASETEPDFFRRDADARMRSYPRDYREQVPRRAPPVPLQYTWDINILEPTDIPANPAVLRNDVAPLTRWDWDLLDANGAARFRAMVQFIEQMCENIEVEM